mmetsp:Transcript_23487/g.54792  ORF Transcript_23487/g.54792 Transcript_23487/m.54792 type:complete len:137 (+) Transcript_23487:69-479(+)
MEPGSNIWNSQVWQGNSSRTSRAARTSYHPSSTMRRRDGKAPGSLSDAGVGSASHSHLAFAGGAILSREHLELGAEDDKAQAFRSRSLPKLTGSSAHSGDFARMEFAGTGHPTEHGSWGFGPFYAPTSSSWLKLPQ